MIIYDARVSLTKPAIKGNIYQIDFNDDGTVLLWLDTAYGIELSKDEARQLKYKLEQGAK